MSIYGLSYVADAANTGAYYELTLSSGTILNGAAALVPTALGYTYFSSVEALQLQTPAGSINVGGTVEAGSNNVVAGTITADPPINVDVTVSLLGDVGTLDTYTLAAGQTQGSFSWNVAGKQGYANASADSLTAALPQAKR